MKIAQIICTFPPYKGGMGNSAYHFARVLQARGAEVTTFTPKYKDEEFKDNSEVGEVIRLKPLFKYGNAAFLPQLMWKLSKYDVILLHYPFFGAAEIVCLAKLFKLFKGKLLIYYHMDVLGLSPLAKIFSLPDKLCKKMLFDQAAAIFSSSLDYLENSAIKNYYLEHKEKFKAVPLGVDIAKFFPAPVTVAPLNENAGCRLLFVGGLDKAHYFKGLNILIESLSQLKDKDWRLNIVGKGELQPEYEKIITEKGIANKVNFLGGISDEELPARYREADIFILPSINKGEAFGMVLLEAMASGAAVIASNLPGVRSVFQEGKQGLLAAPNDVNDLKEKIEILINDQNLRKQMGREGRKLVEEKYSWEKVGDSLKNRIIFN